MNWKLLFGLLPLITSLVQLAEGLFGDSNGVTKKAFVKDGIKTVASGLEMGSTGGQKETWGLINLNFGLFEGLIDAIAGALFPSTKDPTPTNDDESR